jgi:hypothetical protein
MLQMAFTLAGRKDLLVNRGPDPYSLIPGLTKPKVKKPVITDVKAHCKEMAEKATYKVGNVYVIPGQNIFSCALEAAKTFKLDASQKKAAPFKPTTMVKGSIDIQPEFLTIVDDKGKPVKSFETSVMAIRNKQGQKIASVRALFKMPWRLEGKVLWNPVTYGLSLDNVKDLFKSMGDIGIGDWHPRFGAFDVEFGEVKEI